MQHAQIIVFGIEGPLLESLSALAESQAAWLREVRHRKTCLNLVRQTRQGALVLKLGRDVEEELAILEQVSRMFPDVAAIVVQEAAHPALAALAWDLGAHYVLTPPQSSELLLEIVKRSLPRRS